LWLRNKCRVEMRMMVTHSSTLLSKDTNHHSNNRSWWNNR
jgi:hypothetical protein